VLVYAFDYLRLATDFSVTVGFYIDRIVPFADRRTLGLTPNTLNRFQIVAHNNGATPICGCYVGDGSAPSYPFSGNTAAGNGWLGVVIRRKNQTTFITSYVGETRFAAANFGADVAPTTLAIGSGGGANFFGPVRNVRIWANARQDDIIRQWGKAS